MVTVSCRWYGNCFCERCLEVFWQQRETSLVADGTGRATGAQVCPLQMKRLGAKTFAEFLAPALWRGGFRSWIKTWKLARCAQKHSPCSVEATSLTSVCCWLLVFCCLYKHWNNVRLTRWPTCNSVVTFTPIVWRGEDVTKDVFGPEELFYSPKNLILRTSLLTVKAK